MTTTEKTYACAAGIKLTPDGTGKLLWIESPRTGTRLELFLPIHWQTGEILPESSNAPAIPPRMVPRVTASIASGRRAVDFTAAELLAFKRAVDAAANPRGGRVLSDYHRRFRL